MSDWSLFDDRFYVGRCHDCGKDACIISLCQHMLCVKCNKTHYINCPYFTDRPEFIKVLIKNDCIWCGKEAKRIVKLTRGNRKMLLCGPQHLKKMPNGKLVWKKKIRSK